jgi:hypothetical protein
MVWVYANSINGMKFELLRDGVSDIEVLEIIPSEDD